MDIIKEPMITPVRGDAKFDNPPKEYENKDVEAGNFMIKYALELICITKIKKEQFGKKVLTV